MRTERFERSKRVMGGIAYPANCVIHAAGRLTRTPSPCIARRRSGSVAADGCRSWGVIRASGPVAESLSAARLSTRFGVEIRNPSDVAEMAPGDEAKAIEIASPAKQVVLATLVTNY